MLIGVVVVSAIAIWIVSPRFEIDTPSVVDDWAAISPPDHLSLAAWLGNVEGGRYRPGWVVWNYVQWHTLGGPEGLVGPNLWNLVRIAVLVAGLCLLTALALPPPRNKAESVLRAGLAALPALLVVTVPAFAVDLARFGPQEPLLVGAMALGGSLLVVAAQELLDGSRPLPRWRTTTLVVAGSVLWVAGVYQKEASVCVLPLIVAALVAARARVASWNHLSRLRRGSLIVVGAVTLLPLAHIAFVAVRIAGKGDLVYDAEVNGGLGAAGGLVELIRKNGLYLTSLARLVMVLACLGTVAAFFVTRTVNKLAVGAILSGILALLFAGQAGVAVSRYYLPPLALFGVAFSVALACFSRKVQVAGVVAVTALALTHARMAQDNVATWVGGEQEWGEFVRLVTTADATGCAVAVGGLELETSQALPVLVALERDAEPGTCAEGETYIVVGSDPSGGSLLEACAPGALSTLRDWPQGSVYRCGRLSTEPVLDPELGRVDPEQLVVRRRLRSLS